MRFVRSLAIYLTALCFAAPIAADTSLDSLATKSIDKGLNALGEVVTNLIPGEGDTEVTFRTQDNHDLRYSILAVRPISFNPYSQLSNEHLYFTQLRIGNHEPYANGDDRTLLNAGLGFRMLVNDGNAVLGGNIFYDYEHDEGHERASFGIEYLASNFQLYSNIYHSLSDQVNYTIGNNAVTEEVLDGLDYSIVGQLPYMPWGNLVYKGYKWNQTGSDLEGKNISLEAQLMRGLVLEFGRSKPDQQSREDFVNLTFKWPYNHLTPTLLTHTITDYAFPNKNMKNEMLHKIRRTDNIIIKRSGGGVVVSRGT